jgi:hypothetical protein
VTFLFSSLSLFREEEEDDEEEDDDDVFNFDVT